MRIALLTLCLTTPALMATPPATQTLPAGHPGGVNASGYDQAEALKGQVLERIAASPYCYLRLKTSKGDLWAAIPEMAIEPGAEVTILNPVQMGNFESKTLKRTFSEIYFGTGASVAGVLQHPGGSAHPGPSAAPSAPVVVGKVRKATGANAFTVVEIWAKKRELKDKVVVVRGKVVQYTSGVLGKNWVHLQDGSGNAGKRTHDVALTTQAQVTKGDVVTFQGVVRLNKDFGSGYAYEVLIEEAVLVNPPSSGPAKK